jgi:hypothetical protein
MAGEYLVEVSLTLFFSGQRNLHATLAQATTVSYAQQFIIHNHHAISYQYWII